MTNISTSLNNGYSVTTVSRYLNQNGYVSEAAAQNRSIAKLDYAKFDRTSLSIGQIRLLVVVPHMPSLLYPIIAGSWKLHCKRINVTLLQSKYDAQLEIKYLEQLHQKLTMTNIYFSRYSLTEMVHIKNMARSFAVKMGELIIGCYTTRKPPTFKHLPT